MGHTNIGQTYAYFAWPFEYLQKNTLNRCEIRKIADNLCIFSRTNFAQYGNVLKNLNHS